MDEKWIFVINVNRDTNDNLSWNLVEIEKPRPQPEPPPLQSSISMAISKDNGKLGKSSNVCSKGQRDADSSMYNMGKQ